MVAPVERSYGWQVRWRHRDIDDFAWQGVSFRRDEGQTIVNANQLCSFLDKVGRRIADTDEWITTGKYRYGEPSTAEISSLGGVTLRSLIADYELANAGRTPRRIIQMRQRQERYFKDWLDLSPGRITTGMINARYAQLVGPRAVGGFNLMESSALAMMQAIFPVIRFAVEVGKIEVNPIKPRQLSFMRTGTKRDSFAEPLTLKEFYALLELADDFVALPGMVLRRRKDALSPAKLMRLVLEIMGETGMRIGEVLALAVEDVDLDQMILHVDFHMVSNRRVPGTKNGQCRKVFLTEALARRLALAISDKKPADPIFRAVKGGFLTYNGWREMWDRFVIQVNAAGILRTKIDLRPHLFRHSYACWMALKVPAIVLMEMMGHADIKTTQRYYTRGGGALEVARAARQELANAHGHGRHLRAVS